MDIDLCADGSNADKLKASNVTSVNQLLVVGWWGGGGTEFDWTRFQLPLVQGVFCKLHARYSLCLLTEHSSHAAYSKSLCNWADRKGHEASSVTVRLRSSEESYITVAKIYLFGDHIEVS
jgi:hypothetical protein